MNALDPSLRPVHVQPTMSKIDLGPLQGTQLGRPKAMPIGQEDRRGVPSAIPASPAGSLDQPLDFGFGQVLPRAVRRVGQSA
jgi:hypothetical protein